MAAGAYIAYKHYDRVADHFLKEGTNIGRVAPMNEELKDGFYAYTKNSDRKKYTRIFSNRVEHPNTKMNDSQILDSLQKGAK